MIDFGHVYNRRYTDSVKWDSVEKTYDEKDLLPLWVADMDFQANTPVVDALKKKLDEKIFGYEMVRDSLYQAIQTWQAEQHQYQIPKDAILFSSGVVPSIAIAVQAFTEPGDSIMIHDPVYPPFANVVKSNDRHLVRNQLMVNDNHFEIDFETMEQQMIDEKVRLFILCSPHNPGGRVWTADELQKIGALCSKHNILVVSDEIHQDLIFPDQQFSSYNVANPDLKDHSVVLTSATKTFNLAGLKNSMVFIENKDLRKQFQKVINRNQQGEINTFGLVGTEAAYNYGAEWLQDLMVYLSDNCQFTLDYFKTSIPQITAMKPEGTYLMWLDFSAFGLSDREISDRLIHKGKVVLNPGHTFGPSGTQHMRLNLACPKATLVEGLERISKAFEDLL